MDRTRPKSVPHPASGPDELRPDKPTGRVKFDERGNAIWEWSVKTGAFGEVSTARLHKLENSALTVAEDAPTPFDPVRPNPQGTVKGYDPYDSGRLGRSAERPRKKDLRKLSEWVALRKQASTKKADPDKD
jgi:hypothetical protein